MRCSRKLPMEQRRKTKKAQKDDEMMKQIVTKKLIICYTIVPYNL